MDRSSFDLALFNVVYLDQYFGLPEAERGDAAMVAVRAPGPWLDTLDSHLAESAHLGGARLTMADFRARSILHRWMQWMPNRPSHAFVKAYCEGLLARSAFQEHAFEANPPRTQQIQTK